MCKDREEALAKSKSLFEQIKHGDDKHKEWLRVALDNFFLTGDVKVNIKEKK
jgi:hypothetical protein